MPMKNVIIEMVLFTLKRICVLLRYAISYYIKSADMMRNNGIVQYYSYFYRTIRTPSGIYLHVHRRVECVYYDTY